MNFLNQNFVVHVDYGINNSIPNIKDGGGKNKNY